MYARICASVYGVLQPRPSRLFRIPFLGVEPAVLPEEAIPLLVQPSVAVSSAHDRVVAALAQACAPLDYAPQVPALSLVLLQQLRWSEARTFCTVMALARRSQITLAAMLAAPPSPVEGEGGRGIRTNTGATASSPTFPNDINLNPIDINLTPIDINLNQIPTSDSHGIFPLDYDGVPPLVLSREAEVAFVRAFRTVLKGVSAPLSTHLEALPAQRVAVGGGGVGTVDPMMQLAHAVQKICSVTRLRASFLGFYRRKTSAYSQSPF